MISQSAIVKKVRACKTREELDAYQDGARARGYDDDELAEIYRLRREKGWV